MPFSANFSYIVEETEENHHPATSHWQTLLHNVLLSILRHQRVEVTMIVYFGDICGLVDHHCLSFLFISRENLE